MLESRYFMTIQITVQKSKRLIFFINSIGFLREEEHVQQQQPNRLSDINERSNTDLEASNRLSQQFVEDSEHTKKLLQELLAIKQQNNNLQRSFETLKVCLITIFKKRGFFELEIFMINCSVKP